jgi:hypothetical protein
VLLYVVPVAATGLVFDDVTRVDQVGDDGMGAALGDADHGGEVPHPHAGIMSDAQQHPCMVGEEAPTAHANTLPPFLETDCMFLSSDIWCCADPGSWPRSAAAPRQRKGMTMELLVVAIVVLVAFGAYRFMRARAAH